MTTTKRSLRSLIAAGFACASLVSGFAANYNVSLGTGIDHANPSVTGSLAKAFQDHPGANTFTLTSSGSYLCNSSLTLPANATLLSAAGVQPVLTASSSFSGGGPLLWMNSHSKIQGWKTVSGSTTTWGLQCNGNWKVSPVVQMVTGATDLTIDTVAIQACLQLHQTHVLYMNSNTDVLVTNSLFRRAGCDTNQSNFPRISSLITVISGDNIMIQYCDLAVAASAGIRLDTPTNVTIDSNTISDVGRAKIPDYLADGVTSYHTQWAYPTPTTVRNIYVTNNYIHDSNNNGVHISGRGFHILNNHIKNVGMTPNAASSVAAGDQRDISNGDLHPADCSYDFEVNNNWLENLPVGGGSPILVMRAKLPYWVNGNYPAANSGVTTTYTTYCGP